MSRKKTIYLQNNSAAQAQTLPNATLQIGNIHPFSKIPVNFEQIKQFDVISNYKYSKPVQHFRAGSTISSGLGLGRHKAGGVRGSLTLSLNE